MNLRRIIIIAVFAALIVAGSYIAIPVGPVPVTLQTAFVLLAGILGGRAIGLAAVAVYLVLGAIGLPVFSGGIGGFAHFAGPTGGFLISWLLVAPFAGFCADTGFAGGKTHETTTTRQLVWIILGTVGATVIQYLVGLPYLKLILGIEWSRALVVGLVPFIPGDLIKMVAVVILGNLFAPQVRQFLHSPVQEEPDAEETGS